MLFVERFKARLKNQGLTEEESSADYPRMRRAY